MGKSLQDPDEDGIPDIITETSMINGHSTALVTNIQTAHKVLTSPEGREITTTYDPVTLLTSAVSMPGLYDTIYEYYPSGHQHYGRLRFIRPHTREPAFTYDAQGNLYTASRIRKATSPLMKNMMPSAA